MRSPSLDGGPGPAARGSLREGEGAGRPGEARPARRAYPCYIPPPMAQQYIYTMVNLRKVVPPQREILKGMYLSFFPGAKIGVLGLNGAGKSSLLRIMAGVDREFNGEAFPAEGTRVGFLQ